MQPLSASARVVNGRELIDECGDPGANIQELAPIPDDGGFQVGGADSRRSILS